jgi:heme-degrading monooxygenase HmoA
MADIRIHRYTVDPKDFEEFLTRRAVLIAAIRTAQPGLVETRLVRLGNDTFIDTWRWDSAEHMQAGFAAAPTIPEIPAAMSLTRDATNNDGEIIDER